MSNELLKYEDLLIGADPEVFLEELLDGEEVTRAISAHGLIPGTKKKPFKVKNGAVQVDGTALEFNIDPAVNAVEFLENVRSVQSTMREMVSSSVKAGGKYGEVRIVAKPSVIYGPNYFKTIPEEALELGCEPDYNAYSGSENPRPKPEGEFERMRTGAGHIHFGWTKGANITDPGHFMDCRILTAYLDRAFMFFEWDKDDRRRLLYGSWGSFRPKSYGMEYRPLSNAWLEDPKLAEGVFYLSKMVGLSVLNAHHLKVGFNDNSPIMSVNSSRDSSNFLNLVSQLNRRPPVDTKEETKLNNFLDALSRSCCYEEWKGSEHPLFNSFNPGGKTVKLPKFTVA